MGDHRVHVTLNNNDLLRQFYSISRPVQGVQHVVFFKQQRLRRIEIFGLAISHCTPPKANHPAPYISDREDDAVAKVVIYPARIASALFTRLISPPIPHTPAPLEYSSPPHITFSRQPSAHHFTFSIATSQKVVAQTIPLVRRVTQAESDHRFGCDAATLQVRASISSIARA